MLSPQGMRNAPKAGCEPSWGSDQVLAGLSTQRGARITLQAWSGVSVPEWKLLVPREVDVGYCPTQSGTSSVGPSPCWSPGSGSGVCVCAHTCARCLCAEGSVSLLSRVEQPMAGMGVLLRTPGRSCGEHLCLTPTWMRVSEHMAEGEEPSLCVCQCVWAYPGGPGVCVYCPAWLLTDL